MKCDKQTMRLYAVTDRAWVGQQTLYEQVEAALQGGVTCVQLREKQLDADAFLAEARDIRDLCRRYGGTSGTSAAGTGCLSSSTTTWTLPSPAGRTASMWARTTCRWRKSAAGWGMP